MRVWSLFLSIVACAKAPAPPAATPTEGAPELAAVRPGSDPVSIAEELAARVAADQLLRKGVHGLAPEERERTWDRIAAVDEANTARMKALVAERGWIDIPTYGEGAARDAWLLVQHADRDPAFQREVLALMEPLVSTGGVRPKDFAYLWDRVAVAADQPQRYGSQGWCDLEKPEQGWTPRPVEDPEGLDALRATVGLGPMDAYVDVFDCGLLAPVDAAYQAKDWAGCQAGYTAFAETRKTAAGAAGSLYNAMCCAALGGRVDDAFALMERVLAAGFDDLEALHTDGDLEAMRTDPRWSVVPPRE